VDKIAEAVSIVSGARVKSDSCLVFYSGGKDSLCVMDLASKCFRRTVGVFMYFVPGLQCVEKQLDFARARWPGVEILKIPHWVFFRCYKNGIYRIPGRGDEDIPDVKILHLYHYVMNRTGINFIATGAKAADSIWRKRNLNSTKNYPFLLTPLKSWNKYDVLYYLRKNEIPLPDSDGKTSGGIDLTAPPIYWLYDKHKPDYDRLAAIFPFIGAKIKQRELYGGSK
jgi:phosphoadenosine phosphosulfate reductase